ncbi:MAG TPA: hypothetical protein PKD90_19945 [Phnomibacter sp.]|nr:hypothetical protein [Phnomibacter sp.]
MDEIHKRDSIKQVKDAERAQKQLLKEIKEQTGIEEEPDSNALNQPRKPGAPPADTSKKGNTTEGLLPGNPNTDRKRTINSQRP